jgi:hypothetical protein
VASPCMPPLSVPRYSGLAAVWDQRKFETDGLVTTVAAHPVHDGWQLPCIDIPRFQLLLVKVSSS